MHPIFCTRKSIVRAVRVRLFRSQGSLLYETSDDHNRRAELECNTQRDRHNRHDDMTDGLSSHDRRRRGYQSEMHTSTHAPRIFSVPIMARANCWLVLACVCCIKMALTVLFGAISQNTFTSKNKPPHANATAAQFHVCASCLLCMCMWWLVCWSPRACRATLPKPR